MLIDTIFQTVDEKIAVLAEQRKRPSVIVLNADLFRQMQQDTMTADLSQKSGRVRSPYDLQVYQGLRVIPSEVVQTVEVL